MAVVNQWGKRGSTDQPIEEPEAQRRRLNVNSSPENPSMVSRAAKMSPLEELPEDALNHLLRQMDGRLQSRLAQCSKMFAAAVQKIRWDEAGSIIQDGELRYVEPHDSHVSFQRGDEKLSIHTLVWLSCRENLQQPISGKMPASDQDIGFWLGCRYSHISLAKAATPELMAGLSKASRWRSLTLNIDPQYQDPSELLKPLIDGLDGTLCSLSRELVLNVTGYQKKFPLVIPETLWNSRLKLVGFCYADILNFRQVLPQIERGVTLRYLRVVAHHDEPTSEIIKSIGSRFPALEGFCLVSEERELKSRNIGLHDFQRTHPYLQTFSIFFDASQSSAFQAEFSALLVRRFDLRTPRFIDAEGTFADWVGKNQRLEELHIETDDLGANKGLDFSRLAKALGANQSLRRLSVGGMHTNIFVDGNDSGSDDDREGGYNPNFVNFLKEISGNAHLNELYLDNDFDGFFRNDNRCKSEIVEHLQSLEAVNPGLMLGIVMPHSVRKYSGVVGADISVSSIAINISGDEFVKRFGWRGISPEPGSGVRVEFQVKMPTWGNGAFRKIFDYWRMNYENRRDYILNSLINGSLPKENIQILRVGSPISGLEFMSGLYDLEDKLFE
jgi:hypothetical protein